MSTISVDHLNEVKSALGYPLITYFDWGTDSDSFITNFVIPRVLRKYFGYFPIKTNSQHYITGYFEIPYPDDPLVFRKFRHFFNYKMEGSDMFSSPFLLQSQILDRRSYALYKPYPVQEMFYRVSTAESLVDFNRALQIEDFQQERTLRGSTTVAGNLSIQWSKASDTFEDIPYAFRDDALKLAKAYLLQEAGRLRLGMKISNSKIDIDGAVLQGNGDKWEADVIESWKGRGHAVMVK